MQHDLVRILWIIEHVPFTPVVAHGIGEDVPSPIETRRRNRAADFRIALETVLCVLVPEVERPVGACSAESTVDRVERDGVDGVDVADVAVVAGLLAVAFEGEIEVLVFFFDVLDRAAAFDAADSITGAVCKGAHDSCLPLQRRLNCFEELCRILEVYNVDPAFCSTDHEHFVPTHVHAVDAVFAFDRCDWLLLSQIPVLHELIPRAGDEHRCVVHHDRLYASDRLVVCGHLLCLGRASSKIEHASSFVCTSAKDLLTVLYTR